MQLSRFAKLNTDWSGENAEFTRVVVLGTCTGTVLDLYLSTIFKYLYWYLEPKYWYLYLYLRHEYWYWYWYLRLKYWYLYRYLND